ncbi:MAG: sodium:proton antiporter NhaD [Saprospiraceae bacterium]|nr:sodium:proton antiporter NhaD [Saprospiraceae bacterium]MBK6477894.1 sodium:proton antiporter NhaD [Saprospiraceae bacterium]MBK6816234.1 sodium:proton antiporter NhaD [Saprospiraceae bacterium]MBK7370344.1 sodium:proton antiporter NhaD [Saprospiraceae bacterium]MBK7438053.1 sodium:proton antiporter NhaD [Saprospiraceae bacterium]
MAPLVIICFIVGYLLIVFEHPLRMDKTIPALLMGMLCWAIIAIGQLHLAGEAEVGEHGVNDVILHHLGKIAEILIFLIGAMTIVELVDLHKGFSVITNRIHTRDKRKLLWIVSWLAFFMSAILDNLTTTIVFVSLLRKLIHKRDERLWYISFVVIAANAGGAWTPIGDVTTTMLWIAGKVSTLSLIDHLAIPSIFCLLIPLVVSSFLPAFQGEIASFHDATAKEKSKEKLLSSKTMLIFGISALVFVPIFKTMTHLPPWMGMMIGLSIVWLVSEYIHPEEDFAEDRRHHYSVKHALSRIELSSILFFLGILMAIDALDSLGYLKNLAVKMDQLLPSQDIVASIIGILSAIIDNVPLVAATIGMYDLPMDAKMWHLIAYSAGTGGSMLIIGSAAGVAAMGMEKIDFIWYFKKISWLAAIGYFGGALIMYFIMLIFP